MSVSQNPKISKQNTSNSQASNSQPFFFNCIHCEEESTGKRDSQALEEEFSKYEEIKSADWKDFRLCIDCVNQIIGNLQQKISDAADNILNLQEKSSQVDQIIDNAKTKFGEEDYKILYEKEKDLKVQIETVKKEKGNLKEEVNSLMNTFTNSLKEENGIEEEIADLELQIHNLMEQESIQKNELSQIDLKMKELENYDFIRKQFCINISPNSINGFLLTKPNEQNYMDFNHGLGQLTLLLEFLESQTSYTSRNIKSLQCNGAVSKIERSKGLTIDLFCKLQEESQSNNKKSIIQRLYIPFEGLRELSTELLGFYKFAEESKKNKKKVGKEKLLELEIRMGELQSKQDNKEFWDAFFSQILELFDNLLDVCPQN